MKYLGIDYGRKKIGLSLSEGILAEPYTVVRYQETGESIKKIEAVIKREEVEKVVIGISEGKMADETRVFGRVLEKELKVPVEYQDESLSTQSAQELSMDANIKRRRRKEMEDAFSAAIILQSYLDNL